MANAEKNARISASMAQTRSKRKSQTCRVFMLKINSSKSSKKQREQIARLFLEAKWLYNDILGNDIYNYDTKTKEVSVHTPHGVEIRPLEVIGSQLKQSIQQGLKSSLKSLSVSKKKGRTVGSLRFAKEINSVDLKQFGMTHKFKIESNKIKIQGISGWLKVHGMTQLPNSCDFANAKLLKKPSGYYLAITCFINNNEIHENFSPNAEIGIDFGVKTMLTDSNGVEYSTSVGESDRLKRLQRKLERQTKGSNNRKKTIHIIQREYEKMSNKLKDTANKIVHELLTNERVFMQDDNLSSWRTKLTGKKMQYSANGRIKSKLMNHPRVTILPRYLATTATCVCGVITPHKPGLDTFSCPVCGYSAPRDIHGAQNMIRLSH